jgi:hypothetical protein
MHSLQQNSAAGVLCLPELNQTDSTNVYATVTLTWENPIYLDGNATRGTALTSGTARAETGFERQKRLFLAISPTEREQYNGSYVASYNGAIVDHDVDLPSLTHRFFSHYGDVDVYITKVGERQRVLLRTPRLR